MRGARASMMARGRVILALLVAWGAGTAAAAGTPQKPDVKTLVKAMERRFLETVGSGPTWWKCSLAGIEEVRGSRCYHLVARMSRARGVAPKSPNDGGEMHIWLSIARGLAPVRMTSTTAYERLKLKSVSKWEASGLKRHRGLWIPTVIEDSWRHTTGKKIWGDRCLKWRVNDLRVMDALPTGTLKARFPQGCWIHDERTGKSFRQGSLEYYKWLMFH